MCVCAGENLLYLAPCYVWSGVSSGFTGDHQLSAHLLEILRSRWHLEVWRVLEEGGCNFTWAYVHS